MIISQHYATTGPDEMMVPVDTKIGVIKTLQDKSNETITIDPDERQQKITGFGASMTDSSAFLLGHAVTQTVRAHIMQALFSRSLGAGLSVLRQPMGACDYARDFYSYDDVPTGCVDPRLEHFNLRHDEQYILPMLSMAKSINPQIFVIGSPWSAPAWMKDTDDMRTGHLLPQYRQVYADYFVHYVNGYCDHGVNVDAVTVQNEPLYEPPHYPGMGMSASEEADFVHSFLRPAFQRDGLRTLILGYDHNWDRPDYPIQLLSLAEKDFDGIAWHWYAGDPSAQSQVSRLYPHVPVYFTEGSGGSWIPAYEPAFSHLMSSVISALRNGSRTFVLWNIALDQNNGPTVPNFGKSTCRGLFRIDTRTGEAVPTCDYYGLAHFSTVIDPGSVLISTTESGAVKNVAALNPDGSLGIVLWNSSSTATTVEVSCRDRGGMITVELYPGGAESMRILPDGADNSATVSTPVLWKKRAINL